MAISSPISAGAMRVGESLIRGARSFRRGITSSVKFGSDLGQRTAEKLEFFNAKAKDAEAKKNRTKEKINQDEKRRGKEEELEVKKGRGKVGGLVKKMIAKPVNAFLKLLAAWAIMELPKLIKEIDKFTKKIRIFGAAVKNAVVATGTVFSGLTKVTAAFIQNLKEFDFDDRSGRLKEANKELEDGMEQINLSFSEIKNVWGREEDELDNILDRLTNGQSLQQAVANATVALPNRPTTSAVGSGSGGPNTRSSSSSSWKPVLDLIAQAESVGGSYDSIYPGSIKPGLSEMTIGEADAWQARTAKQRGSAAAGRYQFMNILSQATLAGLGAGDKFSPANQDKMAIALIEKKREVSVDMLKDNPIEAARRLAMEWAGLPVLSTTAGASRTVSAGQSYYSGDGLNKATISTEQLTSSFQQAGTEKSGGGQMPQAAPTGDTGSFELTDKVPFEQFSKSIDEGGTGSVGKTSSYGPRISPGGIGSTNHKGIDIGTSGGRGWYCAIKINGTVTFSGSSGGYGRMVTIRSGKYEYRFAHLRKQMVKAGQKYNSGMIIGEIGNTGNSTGEHLHFEVLVGGVHTNPESFLNLLEIGRLKTRSASASNVSGTATARADSVDMAASAIRTNNPKAETIVMTVTNTILT